MSYFRQMKFAKRHANAGLGELALIIASLSAAHETVDCPMKHRQRLRQLIVALAVMRKELSEMSAELEQHLGKESP